MMGVLLNILLFIAKYFAGKISGSVSIMADAFNNLTDAGTFCMSALGIKIASVGPGKNHPKGHGKFEWIVALITSLSVFLVGWELAKTSVESIKNPANTVFSWITFAILVVSILVKVFLYIYNIKKSKSQNLLSLKAVAIDSISDALSTTAVLLSLLLNCWFGWKLDGWFGLGVSILIIYNAIASACNCITKLVDKAAPKEKIDELINAVKNYFANEVPIYDVEITDCGLSHYTTTFHLLSTETVPISELVQKVPLLQKELKEKLGYTSVIQIEEGVDKQTQSKLLNKVESSLKDAGFNCKLSEARVVKTANHHLQLIMTVLVSCFEKQQIEKVEEFLSDKLAIGLNEQDSVQMTIRLGGHQERRHGFSRHH